MSKSASHKVCQYIAENFRPKYDTNVSFAQAIDVDEKTVRLIIAGEFNMSINLLQKICDSQNISLAEFMAKVGI